MAIVLSSVETGRKNISQLKGSENSPEGVVTAAPPHTPYRFGSFNTPKGEEKITDRKIPYAKTPALREAGRVP